MRTPREEVLISLLASAAMLASSVCLCAEKGEASGYRIFDGKPKSFVVCGYSTSFRWPAMLREKLDRMTGGERIYHVLNAAVGGSPVSRWIDVEAGTPKRPYNLMLQRFFGKDVGIAIPPRRGMRRIGDSVPKPTVALCQQSLQGIQRADGKITPRAGPVFSKGDKHGTEVGARAFGRLAEMLHKDGCKLVFIAAHIYKEGMEPNIGNERFALDALMKKGLPYIRRGPDVWTPTKRGFPELFARDRRHPNERGAAVMAQAWFETLLAHDGLPVPEWSKRTSASEAREPSPSPARAQRPRRRPPRRQHDPNVERIEDIVFGSGGGRELRLDIIRPKEKPKSPMPVVVWVHGGAWRAGSRKGGPAGVLASKGYFVASIEYRLSQEATFPAQIEDCKCAIRYLRAHAKKYNIDSDHIGVWGSSAGGHLVALLGTSGDVEELEGKGGWQDQSSRVQAVCDWFGPTDFPKMGGRHDDINSPECQLVGGSYTEKADVVRAANPITYVSCDDPPFLIMHGEEDRTVPINQSELLDEALTKAGVEVTFVRVKNAGHGFRQRPGGPRMQPGREEMQEEITAFFDRHLKKQK